MYRRPRARRAWRTSRAGRSCGSSARAPTAGKNPKRTHNYTSPTLAPYPLVWSTGLARAGVGCQGPCPTRSWPVDGGGRVQNPRRPSSRGSRVRPQLNPTRITRLPLLLPRLDALDGRQGPAPRPAGWDSVRGLEPNYAYGRPGGRMGGAAKVGNEGMADARGVEPGV